MIQTVIGLLFIGLSMLFIGYVYGYKDALIKHNILHGYLAEEFIKKMKENERNAKR